jgi:small subunit ribosomal protein S20
MPVIRSAKKKLKVDKKRESANKKAESFIDLVLKKALKKPTTENIRVAFKAVDKAVKKDIFHKNKAARIKSKLAKLINKKSQSPIQNKALKLTNNKTSKKERKIAS